MTLTYRVYLTYSTEQEIEVVADDEDEAIEQAWKRFDPICGREEKDATAELIEWDEDEEGNPI